MQDRGEAMSVLIAWTYTYRPAITDCFCFLHTIFFLRHIGRLLPNFSSLFVASGKAAFCQGQSSALHRWAYLPYREDTTTSMVQGGSRWFCCCQLRLLQLVATYAETNPSTAGETTGGCSAGNLSEGPT